jgi:hypothetical protein
VLTSEEQDYVIQQIELYVLAYAGNLRQAVTAPLKQSVALKVKEMPTAQAYSREVVRVCIEDGWNEDPCSLYSLMGIIPQDVQIQTIRNRISVAPVKPLNPLLSTVLFTNSPFVNRTVLRNKLKVLAGATAPRPILIVTGSRGAGKTYTVQYLDHFRSADPSHHDIAICRVDFIAGTELKDLAKDMVATMGRPTTGLPVESTVKDRYPLDVANWVLTEAAATTYRWWFVLDRFVDFDGDQERPAYKVPKEIRAFVNFLADRLTTGIYRQQRGFRLILLGYERALLTMTPGVLDLEPIKIASDLEIEECAKAILSRLKPTASIDAPLLIGKVLEDLPEDETRMAEANARLTTLLESVEAINEQL